MTAPAFIRPSEQTEEAPILARRVQLDAGHGDVVTATLELTALGTVEAWVDGHPVSEDLLSPGWTSYEWRLRVVSHDVSALVSPDFTLALLVGNGWYRGHLGFGGASQLYGTERAGWARLRVTFADGHQQTVVTDDQWGAHPSGILSDDLYNGQTIDARHRPNMRNLGDAALVTTVEYNQSRLTHDPAPAVRRQQTIKAERVWQSESGATLLDFGQNLVGWLRVNVRGAEGEEIILRHAEVLDNGDLATAPLRGAQATDRYILSGGADTFEPTLTFHGFRYAEVVGWPAGAAPIEDSVTAVVVHSDLRRTGWFETSNELLNQLHSNVVWGLRGNFLSIPTDCPQRDERLGWTGDISVFTPTAAFLYDSEKFLSEWLRDLDLEQRNTGGIVPVVVPNPLKYVELPFPDPDATAIWGDAAVWVPWALWEAYGHQEVLERQFPSMRAHADRIRTLLSESGVWDQGFQFGDWLDPTAPPEEPWNSAADKGVVATACAYRTFETMAQTAAVLGEDDAAEEYRAVAENLRHAFVAQYVGEDGVIVSDSPTVYTLAIAFGLLQGDLRQRAADRLAELVASADYRISTGFAGTPYITEALSDTGHIDHAYRLLLQTECPSWLYPVTMGATTIWERWDSMLPDGSINPGEMTSFNHYALGSIADWMHRVVGGVSPLAPGYARVLIAPRPGPGVDRARTRLETAHGLLDVAWRIEEDTLHLDVVVPAGVEADVRLGQTVHSVTGGVYAFQRSMN